MKRVICLNICLIIVFSFFIRNGFSKEFLTEPKVVELSGEIVKRQFFNPNTNKQEDVLVLRVDTPIDVVGDEFSGSVKEIKEIQIILFSKLFSYKVFKKKYLNHKVIIKGSLFHAHTVHHYTKVLFRVREPAVIISTSSSILENK